MSSPIIWGGNGALNLQQGGVTRTNGQVLLYNGAKNYLVNPLAETGTIAGWSLGTVTLTSAFPSGTPTFGSGASGNLALTATSTIPLAGAYSFSYASSAATTAGNFLASDAFIVDPADLGKVLTVQFYYQATSNGSNGNWSGTSSNSFGIALYDVTAGGAAWIMPAGVWGMTQNSGAGIATATFQSSVVSGQQYRLVVFNANASAGAITVYFDQLIVGPQTAPIGASITDPQPYSPTFVGFGSPTLTKVEYYQVGAYGYVDFQITQGTNTGVPASMSLPPGWVIDTAFVGPNEQVGTWSTSATPFSGSVFLQTGTSTGLVYFSNGAAAFNTALNGNSWANSTVMSGSFRIKLAGASSNVQLSNSTDTRVISMSAIKGASGAVSANTTIPNWTNVTIDRAGAFNASTGVYTVPVAGDYQVSFYGFNQPGSALGLILKNGSIVVTGISGDAIGSVGVSGLVGNCKAGDTISVALDISSTIQNNATQLTTFSLYRLSGPAVVAATESVNARYYASATAISGSLATVVWTTKDYDTHNAMSSGVYIIPVSGKYQVNSNIQVTGTIALNSAIDAQLQKNGTAVSEFQSYAGGAMTAQNAQLSDTINCNAGDTIRIQLSSGATLPVIASGNTKVFFSIERVGN